LAGKKQTGITEMILVLVKLFFGCDYIE